MDVAFRHTGHAGSARISEAWNDNTSVFDMYDAYDGLIAACVARSSMSRRQRPPCC